MYYSWYRNINIYFIIAYNFLKNKCISGVLPTSQACVWSLTVSVNAGPDTGPTVNPMFGTDILDTQGSDAEQTQRRNPVWESRSPLEPQGGAPNPLYGSPADILASRDSIGAMRNPVWESHSAEAPVGSSNPLFGTGVLDTTDSINGGNPLYETNRRRQGGQQ